MIDKLPTINEGQTSQLGKHSWSVARLIQLSSHLEVMEIPLKHLNVFNTYNKVTLREMVSHMRATQACDLRYPIILDEDGEILDGRHRIMKSLYLGKETIKAVRFDKNPSPCRVGEE